MNKKYTLLIVIVIIISSFAAFSRIAGNDFINLDDNLYITENPHIKSGINPASVQWAFSTVDVFFWQPLTWLSHMLDWSFFQAKASGHHLVSLILHIGSVIFLFLFLHKSTNNVWPSAFAAGFFALHPLRVESVAWAAERKDVLSMFLGMACIYSYAAYAESRKLSRYVFCLMLFVLSLMAKPMMITLPVVLLLLDYWPLERRPGKIAVPLQSNSCVSNSLWKEKIPFFLFSIASGVLTLWGQKKFGVLIPLSDLPFSTRIANALFAYISYLGKIFWPHDLAVYYSYEQTFQMQTIFISFFILTAITILIIKSAKKWPFLFVGWIWYLATLLPISGFMQVASQAMADRFTYLPSIGITIMLSWGIPLLYKREKIRSKVLFPSAIFILFVLTLLTWQQCGYWKNSITLFGHALQVTRNNAQAHHNLGLALFNEGKIEEAIHHYDTAIQIKPDVLPFYNRGNAFIKRGQYQHAIEDFNKAIYLSPNCLEAYYNRGTAYYKISRYQQAIEDFSKAILLKPDYLEAYNNRGLAYGQLGNFHQAIMDFNKVITLKSNYIKAYNNRGLAYAEIGQYQSAINDFNKATDMDKNYADAYNNRAAVYLSQGHKERGCPEANKACVLGNCRTIEIAKGKGFCL